MLLHSPKSIQEDEISKPKPTDNSYVYRSIIQDLGL